MTYVDFINTVHTSTKRDYLLRVTEADKAECAEKAVQWGYDYWDGDRTTGYGGFHYDGRWRPVAEAMAKHYSLKNDARILDVGCGKGFLLYEFTQVLPGCEVVGIDISEYAIEHAKEEVKPFLEQGDAATLPYADNSFDFVVSITTLHNLLIGPMVSSISEIERVGRGNTHITVEGYRNEREKVNLMYWQLTCRAFHMPEEWEWIFKTAGYSGDYGLIFFE